MLVVEATTRTRFVIITLTLGLSGCSPIADVLSSGSDATGDTEGSDSTGEGSDSTLGDSTFGGSTTATAGGSQSATEPGSSGGSATATAGPSCDPEHPDNMGAEDCSLVDQDCGPCEKCTPIATLSSFDATRCVPDEGDKQAGEYCVRVGDNDDCAKGLYCENFAHVESEDGLGVCTPLCDPEVADSCQQLGFGENATCETSENSPLSLCLQLCDPLAQNCPETMICSTWHPPVPRCMYPTPELSGGAEECHAERMCEPGLMCVPAERMELCQHELCCTPWCELDNPMFPEPCSKDLEECVPVYDQSPITEDLAPGLDNIGWCEIPS